jgi:hypothetical protein
MEIYKDIKGYEGLYQISNLGNVKSFITGKWKVLKGSKSSGYNKIVLRKDGKKETQGIHRLVAIYFIPNPDNKPQVNHIDKNSLNNSFDNLEWVDNRENMSHSWMKTGRKTSKFIGVCWKKREQKWSSEIYINKQRYFLGMFDSEFEASFAYRNKLKEFNLANSYS